MKILLTMLFVFLSARYAAAAGAKAGFKLLQMDKGSVFETMGLRIGDTIQKVDGQEVSSIQDLMSKANQLKPGDHIEVTLLRNGKLQTLRYNMK